MVSIGPGNSSTKRSHADSGEATGCGVGEELGRATGLTQELWVQSEVCGQKPSHLELVSVVLGCGCEDKPAQPASRLMPEILKRRVGPVPGALSDAVYKMELA